MVSPGAVRPPPSPLMSPLNNSKKHTGRYTTQKLARRYSSRQREVLTVPTTTVINNMSWVWSKIYFVITRKRGNCECIATWGCPMPQVLFRFNFDAHAKFEVACWRFCCWYITLRCDLDLWPCDLDLDLWPWTFAVYCLYNVMKLCTKFERNQAIRGGVIAISVRPYDLEHVLRVALGSGIIFTMFDFR